MFDDDFLNGLFGGPVEKAKKDLERAALVSRIRDTINKHSRAIRQIVDKLYAIEDRIKALEERK